MKISIITPSFNSADYIERAIKSVLEQKYDNFEHIIVDGASTDDNVKILIKYTHLKWISEPDNGQADAMNKGFGLCSGDIIVYLNCDDYFLPKAFESIVPHFNNGSKFVVGNIILQTLDKKEFLIKPNIEYKKMLKHWENSSFPNNPVQYFYAKEVQERFPFNIQNKKTMDLEFLCDAASFYQFDKIDATLGVYPLLEDAVSVRAQKEPYYWSFETFSFLDKHLLNFTKDEILEFKKEQQLAYLNRTLQTVYDQSEDVKYKSILSAYKNLIKYRAIISPFKKIKAYKDLLKAFSKI